MANRLIHETSLYLRQHAHNPVDWYPWGPEAFQRAREEDKPILLSIGYSACHWCHVMERESFENPEIARIMNQHFINIKVDREERPDVDSIYMQAVQAMVGQGGWPLTVFLTPDGKPFYGGTYMPPEDRYGMPGFPRVLLAVAQAYRQRRHEVTHMAEQLVSSLRRRTQASPGLEMLTLDVLHEAYQGLASEFDARNGGMGPAPKFPQPMVYEFLLRYHHRFREPRALEMVTLTLEKMAYGGIYDHIGGGFHRYATDAHWLVPHFEKMLYDNALLSRLYLHAYQVTGQALYRRVVEETLDYVLREMTHAAGGFCSSQDADSEGVEGKYYLWTREEIQDVLGTEEASLFCAYFGVTARGNFEGRNILHVPREPKLVAQGMGLEEEELEARIQEAKGKLLEARRRRVPPGRDEKVITAWNGLMLRSLAEAACVLHREDYLQAALANASFLLDTLRKEGRLLRTYGEGQAKLKGYLEDYAFLIDGLIALYEATFDPRWLEEAQSLAQDMIALFWEADQGLLYDTGKDHEGLVVRPRDFLDNAIPCGSSMATDVLLRLALLTGQGDYSRLAATLLRSVREFMAKHPLGMGHWLCALDFYLSTPKEIAIVGPRQDPATMALLKEVYSRYLPNRVLVSGEPGVSGKGLPLLQDRGLVNGRPTAYVCRQYTCDQPVNEPEALARQLEA